MLLVTGTIGAGKTSVAAEVAEILVARGTAHAVLHLTGWGRCIQDTPMIVSTKG